MFKKHMKPLTKGGQTTVHPGKGSTQQPLNAHNNVITSGSSAPNATINNYAKATPMANPSPPDGGLGSGSWPGIGI